MSVCEAVEAQPRKFTDHELSLASLVSDAKNLLRKKTDMPRVEFDRRYAVLNSFDPRKHGVSDVLGYFRVVDQPYVPIPVERDPYKTQKISIPRELIPAPRKLAFSV